MLTEIEAWQVLSIVFRRRTGLCSAIHSLEYNKLISYETACCMLTYFSTLPDLPMSDKQPGGYKFPLLAGQYDCDRLEFISKQIERCNNA